MHIPAGARADLQQSPLQYVTSTSSASQMMLKRLSRRASTNGKWAAEGTARAERDGTRAETRFRLSPKRTSPFKLVGASVQSTAGSRGVRISLSNAG